MFPTHPIERAKNLMCFLAFLDDAEGLGSNIFGVIRSLIPTYPYGWILGVFGDVDVGRKA